MKTIDNWSHLLPYGIDALTGEACALSYRLLCDTTEKGRKILSKLFGIPNLQLAEPWNSGSKDDHHVGSIMLVPDLLVPIAVFALLESGCVEVFTLPHCAFGMEQDDDREEHLTVIKHFHGTDKLRRFAYQGTARDRNVHQMSGRVE